MAEYRDAIRTAIAVSSALATQLGKNLDDTRLDSRGTQATAAQIARLTNASTPTTGHGRQYADDFAAQVFNGTNQEFTISLRVLGQNIMMWRVEQSTGTLIPLAKTTNPAPAGNEFWFDDQFTVRVGTAPGTFDALLAVYVSTL